MLLGGVDVAQQAVERPGGVLLRIARITDELAERLSAARAPGVAHREDRGECAID